MRCLLTKKWADGLPKATIMMLMSSGSGVGNFGIVISMTFKLPNKVNDVYKCQSKNGSFHS